MHFTVGAIPVNQDSSSTCFMLLRIPTEVNGAILGGKMSWIWFQGHLAGLSNELKSCNAKPLIAWKAEFEQKEGTNVNLGESTQNIPGQKAEIKFP